MKKLTTILAVVTTAVVLAAAPAGAESTANTGTYGPAEEPTWVIPFVIAFAVVSMVVALLGTRRNRAED